MGESSHFRESRKPEYRPGPANDLGLSGSFGLKDHQLKGTTKKVRKFLNTSHIFSNGHNTAGYLPLATWRNKTIIYKQDLNFSAALQKLSTLKFGILWFRKTVLHSISINTAQLSPLRAELAPGTESLAVDDHSPQSSQRPTAHPGSNLWGQSQTDL